MHGPSAISQNLLETGVHAHLIRPCIIVTQLCLQRFAASADLRCFIALAARSSSNASGTS
eukprot:2738411-Amphidinium_carterae.2